MTADHFDYRRLARTASTPGFFAYFGGYIALLAWFKVIDVYHAQFATKGLVVATYNAFRVLFVFYMFWIVYAAGAFALRRLGKFPEPHAIERFVLGFFAGAGLWHIALLALGYLNLYIVPAAIMVTVPAVIYAYPDARIAVSGCRHYISSLSTADRHDRIMACCIAVTAGLLLIIKGLYPGGGHDYYTHYFYYYQSVIKHAGIWPNEVWYHYYYSKGLGLDFLGMLLTDPLAPQLVTSSFMIVAAAALFLAVRDIAPATNWPMASVLLFAAFYIVTPYWGEFEKQHEFNTALIVGVIWMTQRALRAQDQSKRGFVVACGLAIATAIIINTQIGAFYAAIFGIIALVLAALRDFRAAALCAGFSGWAALVVLVVLTLNYVTTGLPIDQPITRFWPWTDVEKLHELGSLPMVLNLYLGTKALIAAQLPLLSRDSLKLIAQTLRLDLLYPLIGLAVITAVLAFRKRKSERPATGRNAATTYTLIITAACLLVCLVIALTIGRAQPVSYHRYSTFTVPVVILGCVALWHSVVPRPDTMVFRLQTHWTPLAVVGLCLLALAGANRLYRYLDTPANPFRFAAGALSIDEAYTRPLAWSPRLPWGAIYPGSRGAYEIVGPRTPIWTMHIHSYCMLPDCVMEAFMSFNMTKKWDRIMFGSPEEARDVLQAAGINFFLFSSELGIVDPLPRSRLFSPDNIANNLALRWTDGTTSLLTWPGPDTRPLDEVWLAKYRKSVADLHSFPNSYIDTLRGIYERFYAMPHPWKPIALP
jgi:hypothetical protein